MTNTASPAPTHVAREHYSGMWAVVDTRDDATRYLYPDRETAERVASRESLAADPIALLGGYNAPAVIHGPNADGEYPCSGLATRCLCGDPHA